MEKDFGTFAAPGTTMSGSDVGNIAAQHICRARGFAEKTERVCMLWVQRQFVRSFPTCMRLEGTLLRALEMGVQKVRQ